MHVLSLLCAPIVPHLLLLINPIFIYLTFIIRILFLISYIHNRLANCTWTPIYLNYWFSSQFGTSGNEIGEAKTQFGKHKTESAKWSFNFANISSVFAKLIWKRYGSKVFKKDHVFRLKKPFILKANCSPSWNMVNVSSYYSVSCIPKQSKWSQFINENSSNWMIKADVIKMNPVSWILRARCRG